jgi:alkylated DNA repair dioxygenase AlkB
MLHVLYASADMYTNRDKGVPVVSLSLGDTATFHYKETYSKKAKVGGTACLLHIFM